VIDTVGLAAPVYRLTRNSRGD